MLRCTHDTTVLYPDDHRQDHEQHPANHGHRPRCSSSSNPFHTTASSTARSSGVPSGQGLASQLTPSQRTSPTWGNGLCVTQERRGEGLQDGAVQGAAVAGHRVAAGREAVL